jgi:hypothetical protein
MHIAYYSSSLVHSTALSGLIGHLLESSNWYISINLYKGQRRGNMDIATYLRSTYSPIIMLEYESLHGSRISEQPGFPEI